MNDLWQTCRSRSRDILEWAICPTCPQMDSEEGAGRGYYLDTEVPPAGTFCSHEGCRNHICADDCATDGPCADVIAEAEAALAAGAGPDEALESGVREQCPECRSFVCTCGLEDDDDFAYDGDGGGWLDESFDWQERQRSGEDDDLQQIEPLERPLP